jgi:hypothetical protein
MSDLSMIAANERHCDVSRLKLIELGSIVGLSGGISPVDRFRQAVAVQLLLHLLGDTPSKGRVVVEDRDLPVRPMVGQVIADHDTVGVVTVEDAENIGPAQLGQHRVARRRRNHQNSRRLVDFR